MPRKPGKPKVPQGGLSFTALVEAVRQVHEHSAAAASRAVNTSLTLRNWAIGCYIVEYEQNGADRAQYGERLIENLADAIAAKGVADMSARSLRLYRQFFLIYPQIRQSVIATSRDGALPDPIWRSLTAKFAQANVVRKATTSKSKTTRRLRVDGRTLISRLSFTHLAELIAIDDPLKR